MENLFQTYIETMDELLTILEEGLNKKNNFFLKHELKGVMKYIGVKTCTSLGKQEFRRTDFGSRLLTAEGEGQCG